MTTRRRSLACKPTTDPLETRQLLARVVTGVDIDGDRWFLRLIGPGDLRVVNQDGPNGRPVPLSLPGSIKDIDVAGPSPFGTRLVGKVFKATDGDGKVFFQNFTERGGFSEGVAGSNGINTIDIPNFWLGLTDTTPATTDEPTIAIPDGVNTLRFGGVDVTFAPPGGTAPSANGRNDQFAIDLGLPKSWGTSIVIDKSISSAQQGATAGQVFQDSVLFLVDGRINTFQANSIEGNKDFAPTGLRGGGGTLVISTTDEVVTIVGNNIPTQIAGPIGHVRVGNNATNFSVLTNDKIANFFIGGETDNVSLLAPNGSRTIAFGTGMDNVTIRSHFIETLSANRGAVGSNVFSERQIGRVTIGGDVVNSRLLAGYFQFLDQLFTGARQPDDIPKVQDGGAINNVLIAGNVIDSVFAASVDPLDGLFSVPKALKLPHGNISAKIEGKIAATDPTLESGFFAKLVELTNGPIVPPGVPQAPYHGIGAAPTGPRVARGLQPTSPEFNFLKNADKQRAAAHRKAHRAALARRVPAGPRMHAMPISPAKHG